MKREKDDKILEAYREVLNEQRPKDPSGERELFVNDTINQAVQYMDWGVITRGEYNKVKDFMKKTIKF